MDTSSESEEEEVEQRPESITDLSLEYLQIKKLVKYMKVLLYPLHPKIKKLRF